MIVTELTALFIRELNKTKEEISQYPDEHLLWSKSGSIGNSTGNLVLHLCGNLQHFIGSVIGKTGYIRQRDLEFSSGPIPRSELTAMLDKTIDIIGSSMLNLRDDELKNNYPLEKHGHIVSYLHMLLHLYSHLNYHLGQINYHRRMI